MVCSRLRNYLTRDLSRTHCAFKQEGHGHGHGHRIFILATYPEGMNNQSQPSFTQHPSADPTEVQRLVYIKLLICLL
jgi:hypothetical protein